MAGVANAHTDAQKQPSVPIYILRTAGCQKMF